MSFSVGSQVGPYEITEKIGHGGMATVYKAHHERLGRDVAIKVLHTVLQDEDSFVRRFEREARLIARLEHPNIVPIYDSAQHSSHPYLVLRYVSGETLKDRIARGDISRPEMVKIASAVANGLDYAHTQGVLHRDVKPSNILLADDGRIYLTDFGLARLVQAGESTMSQDMMLGTPQYISPEQAKGNEELDSRTDVYSFGVVLYEMVTGRVPFQSDTPYSIVHDHIFTPPPAPSEFDESIQGEMEDVLCQALAKDPDERFGTASELVDAFSAALTDSGLTVSQPPTIATDLPKTVVASQPPGRGVQQKTWIAIAILLCSFAFAVSLFFVLPLLSTSDPRPTPPPTAEPPPATPTPPPEVDEFVPQADVDFISTVEPSDLPLALRNFGTPNDRVTGTIEELQAAHEANPDDGAILGALTLAYLDAGQDEEARAVVEGLMEGVTRPGIHLLTAERLLFNQQPQLASLVLEVTLDTFPDLAVAKQYLMMAYILGMAPVGVVVTFMDGLDQDVPAQQATYQIGEAYVFVSAERYDEAQASLDLALRIGEYKGQVYFLKGLLALQNGDTDQAREAFQLAQNEEAPVWLTPYLQRRLDALDS